MAQIAAPVVPAFGVATPRCLIWRALVGGDELERALRLLREKYPQYAEEPPSAPVLAVDVTEVREWSA